jgi:hypothetical protein
VQTRRAPIITISPKLVPVVGFELTTYHLQGDCTTTVLNRHKKKGSGGKDRTYDQRVNSALLLPLSYSGIKLVGVDGNAPRGNFPTYYADGFTDRCRGQHP